MKILSIGTEEDLNELKEKFGAAHHYVGVDDHKAAEKHIDNTEVVFDFVIDEDPDGLVLYNYRKVPVFLNTCKISLRELMHIATPLKSPGLMFGFNGLKTFVNRPILEVSLLNQSNDDELRRIASNLGTEILIVDDRVGLVTPRVVAMIINEAYYTVQEGTASRDDIDMAMKLGTNYPFGPFEWTKRIGIHHIYELLDAIYDDTHDERYKICPLLKKEYLESER